MTKEEIHNFITYINKNLVNPEFNDTEYEKLIYDFNHNNLNQFYMQILLKVVEKKSFSIPNDEFLTEVTAIFNDKIGKTSTNIKTDEQIIEYIIEIYNFLLLIEILELHNKRF